MRLLNCGVDESWFQHKNRKFIYLGIFTASMSLGQKGVTVRVTAIIEEAERISNEKGWARAEIEKISSYVGYVKVDEILEQDIPLWWKKLKKPKLASLLGKADKILNLMVPTIDRIQGIQDLLDEAKEVWVSEPDFTASKPKLFTSVRDTVLTALPPDIKISSGIGIVDLALGGGFAGPGAPDAGKLIVVCGRPGGGKTQVVINLAARVAGAGYNVAFWSFEMQSEQLALRALAAHDFFLTDKDPSIAITYDQLNKHRLTPDQRKRLQKTEYKEMDNNLDVFHGNGSVTPEMLCSQIKIYAKRNPNTRLIVIDHLGLLNVGSDKQRRDVAIGEATRLIKLTAVSLGIDIILICQLNRLVEGRDSKKPNLSDLRDSGKIEEDCDVCLGLYRPYYYSKDPSEIRELYFLTLKNRQGAAGIEYLAQIYLDNCAVCDTSTTEPFCPQPPEF
jgi:RecA/RadA recombinase